MATFSLRDMLRKFGVVTVMDVEVYNTVRYTAEEEAEAEKKAETEQKPNVIFEGDWNAVETFKDKQVEGKAVSSRLFKLDTLKISNINQEGPTKTITGGMNADTLLKYGKTFTVEMQDALGRMDVLEHIYGAKVSEDDQIVTFSDGFAGELTLVGKTFVIDQKTGAKQPIRIVLPIFLPDSIFNLTMDAEGDATVFDLNGNLLAFESGRIEEKAVGTEEGQKLYKRGADNQFYFFITEEGFKDLKTKGYEEFWGSNTEPQE